MNLQDRVLSFLYRWHRTEAANQIDIIDFDLIGRKEDFPGTFKDRGEALETLVDLRKACEADAACHPCVVRKLVAAEHYLRALMGEVLDFGTYVEQTMGMAPHLIPEDFLVQEMAEAKRLFAEAGFDYTAEVLRSLNERNLYPDADTIRTAFKGFESRIVPQVSEWLSLPFQVDYDIQFVEEDAYWLNWVDTDEESRIRLRFNLHPRKRESWQKSVEEVMVFHEICGHVLQSLGWQKAIRDGKLDPALGLTCVFSLESFSAEGIAQSLVRFFPDPPLTPLGRFGYQMSCLRVMVLNNAHIMANRGESDDTIFEYLRGFFPLTKREEVVKNMSERRNHPLFRTYQYVYGISMYHHQKLAERLDAAQKRAFVKATFGDVLLPQAIADWKG